MTRRSTRPTWISWASNTPPSGTSCRNGRGERRGASPGGGGRGRGGGGKKREGGGGVEGGGKGRGGVGGGGGGGERNGRGGASSRGEASGEGRDQRREMRPAQKRGDSLFSYLSQPVAVLATLTPHSPLVSCPSPL